MEKEKCSEIHEERTALHYCRKNRTMNIGWHCHFRLFEDAHI